MPAFRRVAGLHAAAILLAYPFPLVAQDPSVAGFVASMNGEWFVSSHPSEPLTMFQELARGDSIWPGPRKNADYSLNIALYGDARLKELSCSVVADCDHRYVVEPSLATRPTLGDRLKVAWRRFRSRPETYRPFFMRGTGPVEAVLVRGPAGLDMAPALRTQPAGEPTSGVLLVEAAPVGPSGISGGWQTLGVTWVPGMPALVRDSMPAGLYALRREGKREEAWVLVVDGTAGGAVEAAAAFAELSAPLREWRSSTGRRDARGLLRAFLYDLAYGGEAGAASAP